MITEGKPTPHEVLRRVISSWFSTHHGPLPARVESFDKSRQSISARPVVMLAIDGEFMQAPVLHDIKVMFPQGAGFSQTWTLASGDYVQLHPQSADISGWLTGSSDNSQPPTKRRFSLSDLIAVPGLTTLADGIASSRFSAAGGVKIQDSDITLESTDVRVGAESLAMLEPAVLGTQLSSAWTTYTGAISTAQSAFTTAAPQDLDDCITYLTAIGAATATLAATISSWTSATVRVRQ